MPPIKDEGAPLAFSEIQDEFGEFDITSGLIEYWGAASTLPKIGEEIAFSDFYGAVDLRLSLTLSQSADTELEAAYAGRDEIVYAPEPVTVFSGTAYFGFTNTGQTDGQPESNGYRIFSRDGKTYYATGNDDSARLATQVVGSQVVTERLSTSNAGYHNYVRTDRTENGKTIWTKGGNERAENNGWLDIQTKRDVQERLSTSIAAYNNWTESSRTVDGKRIWTKNSDERANNGGWLDIQTYTPPVTSPVVPITIYNYSQYNYVQTSTVRFGATLYTKYGTSIEFWVRPGTTNLATRSPVLKSDYTVVESSSEIPITTASDFGFRRTTRSAYGYVVYFAPNDNVTNYYLIDGYIHGLQQYEFLGQTYSTFRRCTTSFSYTNISDSITTPGFYTYTESYGNRLTYTYTESTSTRTKPVYTYTNVPDETRPTVTRIGPTPAYGYDLARKYLYRKSQEGGPMYETVGSWPQTNHFSNNWKPDPVTGFSIIQYYSDKMGLVNGQISTQGRETFTAEGVAPADFVGDNIPARLTFDIGQGDASELSYDTFYRLYRSQTNGNVTLGYISPQTSANKPTFTATISGTQTNIILSNLDATRTYRLRWAAYQGAKFTAGSIGPSVSGVSDEFLGDSAPVLTLTGGDDQAYSDFRQGVDLYLEVQVVSLPIVVWAVTRCFEYFRNGDSKLVEANCDFLDGFASESELLAN